MDYRIGQAIRYSRKYAAKAGDRFRLLPNSDGWREGPRYELKPLPGGAGSAIVTGMSYRAMSDWEVDSCDEYYIANGKRELVLLCRAHIRGAEFVVKLEDVEATEPEVTP